MASRRLDVERAAELLQRQAELQLEAKQVIADLDLFDVLGRAGDVRLIGSAVTGLMVWRDLDLRVLAPGLTATQGWAVVEPLAAHPRVYEVRYINQSGTSSFSGEPRDGRFYFQVYYSTEAGDDWKLDISFWLSNDPRVDDMVYVEGLNQRLDPETRLAILWIKSLWVMSPQDRDPAYGREVSSVDIYDAVLEHGVRAPEDFDDYLAARGKPTRSLDHTGAV